MSYSIWETLFCSLLAFETCPRYYKSQYNLVKQQLVTESVPFLLVLISHSSLLNFVSFSFPHFIPSCTPSYVFSFLFLCYIPCSISPFHGFYFTSFSLGPILSTRSPLILDLSLTLHLTIRFYFQFFQFFLPHTLMLLLCNSGLQNAFLYFNLLSLIIPSL